MGADSDFGARHMQTTLRPCFKCYLNVIKDQIKSSGLNKKFRGVKHGIGLDDNWTTP